MTLYEVESEFWCWVFVTSVSSEHTVQVLLCVLFVCCAFLVAVLVVVITQDGHHVVVAKVDSLVHRCVSPPAGHSSNDVYLLCFHLNS